jgi:hypothetical protein
MNDKPKFEPLSEKQHKRNLDKLLYKIGQCVDYQCFYALEEDFNKIGLTIQTTSRNRMILCKLQDGSPVTEKIIDDYIFVGSLDESTKELTDRTVEKICDFVRTNVGTPGKVENIAKVWRNGLRMYQSAISIANEDIERVVGEMT